MDPSNLVFVQIKFKFFTSRYLCIHSFPISMGYIHGSQINLQKFGMENSWRPCTCYKMCINPKMECQAKTQKVIYDHTLITLTFIFIRTFINISC